MNKVIERGQWASSICKKICPMFVIYSTDLSTFLHHTKLLFMLKKRIQLLPYCVDVVKDSPIGK